MYIILTKRDYPYPTEEMKFEMSEHTGLKLVQINNWLINARRRYI
jgi:Homeobox KN domain